MSALSQCSGQMGQPYCYMKLIEAILSALLIVFGMYELVRNMSRKMRIDFIVLILVITVVSLSFNFFKSIWEEQSLLYLEIFFANGAFLTICYYVGFHVLKERWMRILLHSSYAFLFCFELAVLIGRIVVRPQACKEIWYTVINFIAVLLSIFIFVMYWKKQKAEEKYLLQHPPPQKTNNPFIRMWIMIIANIICTCVSTIQSVIYVAASSDCQLGDNQNEKVLINFAFTIFSYYLGIVFVYYVSHDVRIRKQENMKIIKSASNYSNVESGRGKLQLVSRQSRDRSLSIDT